KIARTRDDAVATLAATPLAAFQSEALRLIGFPFGPRLCAALADQLGARRPAVAGLLADESPATRAAAAVVLGMNPDADQVAPLEERWAAEREPAVKLSVAYALARHGRRERLADLVAALRPCKGEPCIQAVMLTQWLPNDLKAGLDQ